MKNIMILIILNSLISTCGCNNIINGKAEDNMNQTAIIRFDKDFYTYMTNPTEAIRDSLIKKYPQLLPVIAIQDANAASHDSLIGMINKLKDYYKHPMLLQIYNETLSHYDKTPKLESEINIIKKNASKELPKKKLPRLSFHVSGFKENVIAIDSIISISADKYLGQDYPYYKTYFEEPERRQMAPRFILRDYLKAWLMSDVITNKQNDLLEAIVNQGKILYTIDKLIPEQYYTKEDITGYTTAQLKWCIQNEKKVWKTITEQAGLHNRDRIIIAGYLNDAPYTLPIGIQSPGHIGGWIGWRIINQYANIRKASLEDIIEAEATTILEGADYNP